MKKEILQFRARSLRENSSRQPPIIKLPLPDKIDDAKMVNVAFPRSKEIDGRTKATMSDVYLYDLVHPLFLNSMVELGTENRILPLFKKYAGEPDKELIKKSGVSKGTFYKCKKILHGKGLI